MNQADLQSRLMSRAPIAPKPRWRRLFRATLAGVIALALTLALSAPGRSSEAATGFALSSDDWTLEYQVKVGNETFQVVRLKKPDAMPVKIAGWPPLAILQNGQLPAPSAPLDKVGLAVWARSDVYNQPAADLSVATQFHESRLAAIRGELAITAVAGAVTGGATTLTVYFLAPQYALPVTKGLATTAAKQLLESPRSYVAFFGTSTGKSAMHHYQQAVALRPQVQVATVDAEVARQYMVHMLQGRIFSAQSRGLFDLVVALNGKELAGKVTTAVLDILKGGATEILDTEASLAAELAQLAFVEDLEKVQSVIGELSEYKTVMTEAAEQIARSQRVLAGDEPINAVTNTRALIAHAAGGTGSSKPGGSGVPAAALDARGLTLAPDVLGTPFSIASAMLSDLGVIKGYPDSTFRPYDLVTRGQIAVILLRTLKADPGGASTFKDLPDSHWMAPYVAEAARRKLIRGFQDGTFRPEGSLTEMEALTVAIRALGLEELALEKGPWPDGYKKVAVNIGLLESDGTAYGGTDVPFQPDRTATRGIVALLFHRVLLRPDDSGATPAERRFSVPPSKLAAYRQLPPNTWMDVSTRLAAAGELTPLGFWKGKLALVSDTHLYLWDLDAEAKPEPLSRLPEPAASLTIEPEGIYLMGANGAIYLSESGQAWKNVAQWASPSSGSMTSFEASGQMIVVSWAGFFDHGMDISTDGGRTWKKARETWPELYPYQYARPKVLATRGSLYAIIDRGGRESLARLRPGGSKFEPVPLDQEYRDLQTVQVGSNGEIYIEAELMGSVVQHRLMVSANDGKTWTELTREGKKGSYTEYTSRGLVSWNPTAITDETISRLPHGSTQWDTLAVPRSSTILTDPDGRWLAVWRGGKNALWYDRTLRVMKVPFTGPAPVLSKVGYTALALGASGTLKVTVKAAPDATFWIEPYKPLTMGDVSNRLNWVVPQSRIQFTGGTLVTARMTGPDTADVEIQAGLKQGLYNLGVLNPDGQMSWWRGAFSVGWKGAPDYTKGGKGIYVLRRDGSPELWRVSVETGQAIPTMLRSTQPVYADLNGTEQNLVGIFAGTGPFQPLLVHNRPLDNPKGVSSTRDGEWVFAQGYLLHHGVPVRFAGTEASAAFSPTGDRVAIGGPYGLDVIRLSDEKVLTLDNRRTLDPVWSPDGEFVAYRTQLPDLNVVPADGRGQRVTVRSKVWSPGFWSPEGRLHFVDNDLVYSCFADGTDLRYEPQLTEWIGGKYDVVEWK